MNILRAFWGWIKKLFGRRSQDSLPHRVDTVDEDHQRATLPPSEGSTTRPTLTLRQIFLFWGIGALVVYASYLIFKSLDLVYLILTGLLISVAMEGFIRRGMKRMKRGLSISSMYVIFTILLLLGIIIIIPFLLNQFSTVLSIAITWLAGVAKDINTLGLPAYIDSLSRLPSFVKEQIILEFSTNIGHRQANIVQNISNIISFGSMYASNIGGFALSLVGSLMTVIGQFVLVIVIAIFFSIEKDRVTNFFVKHSSQSQQYSYFMSSRVSVFYRKMSARLKTQLILSIFIFVVVLIGLTAAGWFGLKLPNIVSLALMAGLTEFIPYIGPIVGAIPAVLVALILYGRKGLIVVSLIYILIQQLESHILIPVLMKKSLGISPLLILLSALFFGSAIGFIGILMAVPFAILITMIVKKDFE